METSSKPIFKCHMRTAAKHLDKIKSSDSSDPISKRLILEEGVGEALCKASHPYRLVSLLMATCTEFNMHRMLLTEK